MSKHVKHVPKHRAPAARRAPRAALRTSLTLSSMAVVATAGAVGGGYLSLDGEAPATDITVATSEVGSTEDTATVAGAGSPAREAAASVARTDERAPVVSRSDRRQATDPAKKVALEVDAGGAVTRTEDMSDEDPRTIGRALLAEFGYGDDQWDCLDSLWTRESNWRWNADNPTSSAYGIPQALPGSKMSSAGADWATNPVTQIRWGLGYIEDRYGSPCGAWGHSESHGWY
ncbi:lytic transglycosylase domain-containing protein [Nocardioides sp. SYSU D00038]|uniref:aggregation-promoting factor C-terminal-like domain-containing protein n=1 Tax=Nocardioides sp. SYSU D00038 TaxID=2812554 RepID=UPI0019673C10|nr:lytic transglycosylase domain-containing protein [Nocardioides sp. SYSU D00038]